MRARLPEWIAAVSAVAISLYVAGGALTRGFPLDDAWIHMVYGLAIRSEAALAYNDGASSTGATSPPWALAAAFAHLLVGAGGPSMAAALALKILGVALHSACAWLAARLASACVRRGSRDHAGIAAGLVVALSPIGAFSAVSGMEVALASAALLATWLATARCRPRLAGLAAGLAVATRPEAAVVLPFAALASAALRGKRAGIEMLGLAALAPGSLALRNLAVSGRPLPATFYQKARPLHLDRADVELRMVFDFMLARLPPYGGVLFAALALAAIVLGLLALARARQRASGARAARIVAGLAATASIAWLAAMALTVRNVTPNDFYSQRYFAPALPALAVAAVVAAAEVGEIFASPAWARRATIALSALVFAGQEVAALRAERARYDGAVAAIDAVQVALGEVVAARVPPGGVVWSQDAGAPRYFGRRRTVDLCRLNTPELLPTPDVAPDLAPVLVVLAPTVFDVEGSLEIEASAAPESSNDRHAHQIALRCARGQRVAVGFRAVRIAESACAR